jgi:hypothetical protein
MMMAPTGSIIDSSGSMRAMAPAGPMPGRTPTTVPRKAPASE